MRRWILLGVACAVTAQAQEESSVKRVYVDLAEVVVKGKVEPVDGISSAGQPDEIALQVFADSGYVAVIDMRGPNENRGIEDFPAAVEKKGMDYIAFPITSPQQFSFDTASELDKILSGIDGPVLLHCGSGNRVGAVLALRESLKGASDDEAMQYGRDAGMTGLEPTIRQVLE